MNILLIGRLDSIFVRELAENLHANINCSITILDLYNNLFTDNFDTKFKIITPQSRFGKHFTFFKHLINLRKIIIKSDSHFDICNIHFLDFRLFFLKKTIKSRCKKLIITTYGTDFFRFKNFKPFLYDYYKKSEYLTFANESLLSEFNQFYKNNFLEKSKICRFGLKGLDAVDKLKKSKSTLALKKSLSLPPNKIIVTIGYSSNPNAKHEEIIASLKKEQAFLKDKIHLLFPMTYGGNYTQIEKVKIALKDTKFSSSIFESYMELSEVAKIRICSDILIHTPGFDQLSGTMQETLYAGNAVITGSWLSYKILDDAGIDYFKVKEINEIGLFLKQIIETENYLKVNAVNNNKIIGNLSSWNNTIKNWIDIYTN